MYRVHRKALSIVICFLLLFGSAAVGMSGMPVRAAGGASASGSCGDHAKWYYEAGTGLLSIEGTGEIKGNSYSGSGPWYSFREAIQIVRISDGVTNIPDYAFFGCTALSDITIPDSVTSIGFSAFTACKALTSVAVPSSVTSIGQAAFSNCTALTSFIVDESNPAFCSDAYGVLYNKDKTSILQYTTGNARTEFKIPSSVTEIARCAFGYCPTLVSVTIPNSVMSIASAAFCSCTALTSITIPDSVTRIESTTFNTCTALRQVTLPNSLTFIGTDAFYDCTALTDVVIPDSVVSIGRIAFSRCTSLEKITVGENNTAYAGDEFGALYSKDKSTMIQYPCGSTRTSFTVPDYVKYIGESAFSDSPMLSRVTIPDTVKSIGKNAFSSCGSLTDVSISNCVTSIEPYTFLSCTALVRLTIPEGVTKIGEYAFSRCSALTELTLPKSLVNIGTNVLNDCTSFTDVYYFGSVSDRQKIQVSDFNTKLLRAAWHYDYHTHIWDDGIVTLEPTCTETGVITYTCTKCTETKTGVVPALGHDYLTVVTEPTCVEKGYTTNTCVRCGDTYEDAVAEPLGHDYIWKSNHDRTLFKNGTQTGVCTRCGDKTAPRTEEYTSVAYILISDIADTLHVIDQFILKVVAYFAGLF